MDHLCSSLQPSSLTLHTTWTSFLMGIGEQSASNQWYKSYLCHHFFKQINLCHWHKYICFWTEMDHECFQFRYRHLIKQKLRHSAEQKMRTIWVDRMGLNLETSKLSCFGCMPLTAANIADLVSVSTYGLDFEAKAIWNGATTNWLKVMCNRTHKEVQLFYVAQFMHVVRALCTHRHCQNNRQEVF